MEPWTRKLTAPAKMGTPSPILQAALLKEGTLKLSPSSELKDSPADPLHSSSPPAKPATPQSSSSSMPPIAPQGPSKKFEDLQEVRRICSAPRTKCIRILARGPSKGLACGKLGVFGEKYCRKHLKEAQLSTSKHLSTVGTVTTTTPTPLRINRFKLAKRYFFVRYSEDPTGRTTVVLKCGERRHTLTLPRGMLRPTNPTKYHYLIRNDVGVVEWRKMSSNVPNHPV